MRIRSIKPEFWASEDIAALPWDARLLFIGLWSYVDDNGVGRDNPKLVCADLFPLEDDPRDTLATVSRGLQTLSERGLIVRYEVDGRTYLYIASWGEHQKIDRPGKTRYPTPTCGNATVREDVAEPSRHSRDTLATGTGEQGNRGAVEELLPSPAAPSRTSAPHGFAEFWEQYPRKVGKDDAMKAYRSAVKRTTSARILLGARRLAGDPNLPDRQFIPHPATWLNRGGWDDEPLPPRAGGRQSPTEAAIDIIRLGEAMQADADRQQIGA